MTIFNIYQNRETFYRVFKIFLRVKNIEQRLKFIKLLDDVIIFNLKTFDMTLKLDVHKV